MKTAPGAPTRPHPAVRPRSVRAVARVSHVCTGIVPRQTDFALDARADYDLARFDRLLARLQRIADASTYARILAALEAEGRNLDVDDLVVRYALTPASVDVVVQLAAFGDRGELTHAFASVSVAQITAGSTLGHCDMTTLIFATRQRGRIAYWYANENGGRANLGVRDQPLSLLEAITLVDAVLIVEAPYPVVDGHWCSGYLTDPTMQVQVRSRFHGELQRWYEAVIAEWTAAQEGR